MSIFQFSVPAKDKNPFSHELPRCVEINANAVDFSYKGLSWDEVRRRGGVDKAKEIYTAAVTLGRVNDLSIDPRNKVNFEYRFKANTDPRRISLGIIRSDGEIGELAFEEYLGNEATIPEEYFRRFIRKNVTAFLDRWEVN